MTAKEYLMQVKYKHNDIVEQEEYIERLRGSLDIQGIRYDRDKIQSSPEPDRISKMFAIIFEEEAKLEKMKDEFVQFKIKVIQQIHQLDYSVYKHILNYVYIDLMNLKQCSLKIGFSYDYTRELHRKALDAFREKFPQ